MNKNSMKNNDTFTIYGNCKCDSEHGICISFRDRKFLGIESQDRTL